ncbi:MAG TPA: nuclear transport factor 2 family protein [Candidatus Cybelea sp.]|nr:nuclear transport factor 2 family protein [Candidatus Cybelea sp.]
MKRFILLVGAALGIACTGSAPAQLPHDALDAVAPVTAVIAAIKYDNAAALSALYADDAVVVDEQAPFEWTGSDAGTQWFAASRDWTKWSHRVAHFRATLANVQVDDGSSSAYVVLAGTFSSADPKKPWQQHGTLTFTLRKTGGRWKISSQAWAQTFIAGH